jgi:SEC-C motif domain protein
MTTLENCPCQSGLEYAKCCELYHKATLTPNNPETLMRSRYSGFVKGKVDYLISTSHPSTRSPDDVEVLQANMNETNWIGLYIMGSSPTDKAMAWVEFVAFYETDKPGQLHERSNFVKEGDRWYYMNGKMGPGVSVGRNDPCVCGSGKKNKKCHDIEF